MSIKTEINAWDGKSADDIAAIYYGHQQSASFVSTLITLAQDEQYQTGATWLLKYHLEKGHTLKESQVSTIYSKLITLQTWQAKLHILQSIPHMPIGKTAKQSLELFLKNCLSENNKFVRAWAYSGFDELAQQYPEYREESQKLFEIAIKDEAASVKARLRNLIGTSD